MEIIDIKTWKRKEHFEFFSQFDDPFTGLVAEIDCTVAFQRKEESGHSFFSCYLHKSLAAVNQIEAFRYRFVNGQIIFYDEIHASTTIGREDGTFGFTFIPFDPDFKNFDQSLKEEVKGVQNSTGLRYNDKAIREDVVHFSAVPWVKFTGVKHAQNFKLRDSAPKIAFGKMFLREGRRIMPVSVHVHHGLADALHIAEFLEVFQELMDE